MKAYATLVCNLGGLAIILYFILLSLNSWFTMGKMENYLVSEMYLEPSPEDTDFAQDKNKELNPDDFKKRPVVSKTFFNEILPENTEVMNDSSVSRYLCCLKSGGRSGKIFQRGRELAVEELNVTRLVGMIRSQQVVKQEISRLPLVNKEALILSNCRRISNKREGEDRYWI